MMEWSPQQESALKSISAWQKTNDQVFRLFGYAGTGKTTLTRHIAENSDADVLFAAYTGKAALVMQKMGCDGAKTIHSAIYIPRAELVEEAKALRHWLESDPRDCEYAKERWETCDPSELKQKLDELREKINEGPDWTLRETLKSDPELIIIDECSMVDRVLGEDLLSFRVKVLVIGDPGQLPPVRGAGFFTQAEPDAMLTEVHRQALGSPVIQMATRVRTSGAWSLRPGDYGDSRYLLQQCGPEQYRDDILGADQVLAGMHATRHPCNARIRAARGFQGDVPMPGERVICCRNNHARGLLNGSLWTIRECHMDDCVTGILRAEIESIDDPGEIKTIKMHAEPFAGREIWPEDRDDANTFDWGYCLTVHKSQGSQWGHVAIINDRFGFWCDGLHDRWLYTGITRAQTRVTIIRPERGR